MSKHTLSVLVEDKPGVLARIAGLFARRGFNIESLAVGPTEYPDVSRMTIVVNVEDNPLDMFSSGYLVRGRDMMPKSAGQLPWRLNQDYLADCRDFKEHRVDDGVLAFGRTSTDALSPSGERYEGLAASA